MELIRKHCDILAYHQIGEGSIPIVFIHGVGLRAESWEAQLEYFANQKKYCCYAIDLPGHGESGLLPKTTLTLADFSEIIHDFIDKIVGKPAILVGHSLGAMTALQVAVTYPKNVLGVAALNAIYNRPNEAAKAVQARAESLFNDLNQDVSEGPIERWFGHIPEYQNAAKKCREWLLSSNRLGYARAYRLFAHLTGIPQRELAQLNCPTLLLTGEFDFNSTPEMSNAMAKIIYNSHAIIVPNSRHMTQMTHVDTVNQSLESFFISC